MAALAEMVTAYRMAWVFGAAGAVALLPERMLAARVALAAVARGVGPLMDMAPRQRPRNRVAAVAAVEPLVMAPRQNLEKLAVTASASFLIKFRGCDEG